MYTKAFIPYRGYFSSPFSRWQGSLQSENAIELVAGTAKRWFAEKSFDPKMFDYLFLGKSITQRHTFYGAAWCAALMGNPDISGLLIAQACTTSVTAMNQAALGIENDLYANVCCLMTDRTSNGPHIIWPNPPGPGGQVVVEDWVMDNFNYDPWGQIPMVETAENVAKEAKITREEQDNITLLRYQQYQDSTKNNQAFQKYLSMTFYFSKKISQNVIFTLDATGTVYDVIFTPFGKQENSADLVIRQMLQEE